ncbi:MAG: hypothetical protein LIO37_00935 [Clostridiales bacterium]|nr:hypothetical protein [Clostridiales bacterium]
MKLTNHTDASEETNKVYKVPDKKRTKKEKNEKELKPGYAKVENIDLSTRNMRIRLVAVIVLIVIAVGAFVNGIYSWLSVDAGWYEIEVGSSAETLEAQELYFYYNIGTGETGAYTEYRSLISSYTNLVDEAYKLFSDESFDDCSNLYYLNHHVNESVTVDDALYEAFELLEEYESRYIYFAPVYATYESLYACSYDEETVNFDPCQNDVIAEYFSEIIAFANNPDSVNIELLGDNQVMLVVSEEYQEYAQNYGITEYVDFFLLANAFEVDYIADQLIADGYTTGTLSSYDGYTRTLGASGDDSTSGTYALEWSVTLTNRIDNTLYTACNMNYSGAASIVILRDYPMYSLDELHYYSFSDGTIRTPYIDTADGYCKSSIHDVTAISTVSGCAEMMLWLLPIYAAEEFDREALQALSEDGIDTVIMEDGVIYSTSDELVFTELYEGDEVTYKVAE